MQSSSEGRVPETLDLLSASEMRSRIAAFDWSRTPLGSIASWPGSLTSAVEIMLTSRYPMLVWWGPELIQFYNDAYVPVLGQRHPAGLGQPAAVCWEEAWPFVGALADAVMARGQSTWSERLEMVMTRNGFAEEVYMTFSYSPICDESGAVAGLFCACTEDTKLVLGDRRLAALRPVADRTASATTIEQASAETAAALATIPRDLPFTLLYLLDEEQSSARLIGHTGVETGTAADPSRAPFRDGWHHWPFSTVIADGQMAHVSDLPTDPGVAFLSPWPELPRSAVVLPLARSGRAGLAGFLVAGISPRLTFDEGYRTFLDLLARQVATALAAARAYEEERRRAEALAEIDRAKTQFFSNVSHEFRTPLTLMLGPLEEVLSHPLPDGAREEVETAHRNGLRLLRLVNTLLDFSRVEASRAQANYQPTDLAQLTADLASSFRSACERAGIALIVDCPPLARPVRVDRDMWEKIVLNLVSNAFKFTFAGAITVRLRSEGGCALLCVEDTGTGIPEHELPHVFDRFHRVENARGRSHEGSGIGLALVRELVRLHGGTISVDSSIGRGSTFTVMLPFGAPGPSAARGEEPDGTALEPSRAEVFVEEALRWLPDAEQESTLPSPERAHPRAAVLLADDNADMRDYLRRLLSPRYEVEAVPDGHAALDRIAVRRPDLLLADVMMPQLDGFGLLRAVREQHETRDLPVILLSARAGAEARAEGLQAGADDYLVKPFGAQDLLVRVAAALSMAQIRRESREREILIDELQHRTRNLLTIVSGVADQTAIASSSLEEFALRFDQRLAALGRVQGLLSRGAQPGVTVDELIRLELAAVGVHAQATVSLDGPDRWLPPLAVQLLALGIHELLTNAVKHGALAGPDGRLDISWTVAAHEAEERLQLCWRERQAMPDGVRGPTRRGFGMELLETLLPFELDARTSIAFTPTGVAIWMDLPL